MEANSEGGLSNERGSWGVNPTERALRMVKVLEKLRVLSVG